MNDEQLELASAYLDGEVTAAERAVVEADDELVAAVERLGAIRSALALTPASPGEVREDAIMAALAAFDEGPATIAAAAAATTRGLVDDEPMATNVTPIDHRRRVRWMQGVSIAAASIVLVVGGVAISQRRGGQDSGVTREQAEPTVTSATPTTATAGPGPTGVGEPMAAPPAAAAEDDSAGESASDTAADEDLTLSEAVAPAAGGGSTTSTPPLDPSIVVRSPGDLREIAESMTVPPPLLEVAVEDCDARRLRAEANYIGPDGTRRPVVVVWIDASGTELAALSLDDCEVVLRAEVN